MKVCPSCGKEYPTGDVCKRDGSPLVEREASRSEPSAGEGTLIWEPTAAKPAPKASAPAPAAPAAAPVAMFCPSCGGEYFAGDKCPRDGTPLLVKRPAPGSGAAKTEAWDEVSAPTLVEEPSPEREAELEAELHAAVAATLGGSARIVTPTKPKGEAPTKFCFFCGREYPITAETCEFDGAVLVASPGSEEEAPGAPRVTGKVARIKYCPSCGKEFTYGEKCPDDGAVLIIKPPDQDPLIGTMLKDSYRVDLIIARGGMGIVYRGTQMPVERAVAIKALLPSLQPEPLYVKRFFREAKILAELNHPNIVSLIDCGNTAEGVIYLVTEFLTGKTLDKVVPPDRGLPMAQIRIVMSQVCAAVGEAHRHQLIHRDLKPTNIFALDTGAGPADIRHVKVLDFGVAKPLEKSAGSELTQSGAFVGTVGYMAPEQYEDTDKVDQRSDIYALGAILYLLASGRPAFSATSSESLIVAQLSGGPKRLDLKALGKPDALNDVIQRAMARDPKERFQSTSALIQAIESCDAGPAAGLWVEPGAPVPGGKPLATTKALPAVPETSPGRVPVPVKAPAAPRSPLKLDNLLLAGAMVAVLGALILAIVFLVPGEGPTSTVVVEIEPEGYDDASGVRGVTETTIVLGFTGALQGPQGAVGRAFYEGLQARLGEVNQAGGVRGRRLDLVALDDGGDEKRAAANLTDLLGQRRAFGFIGNVAVASGAGESATKVASDAFLFAPLSGAEVWRAPMVPNVFTYRPSLVEECAALITSLVNKRDVAPGKIALVTASADSGLGAAQLAAVMKTLGQYGISGDKILRVTYASPSDLMGQAANTLAQKRANVKAVLVLAPYQAAARLVRLLREKKVAVPIAFTSLVGSHPLTDELLRLEEPRLLHDLLVSQVVPPYYSDDPGPVQYRKALAAQVPKAAPGFISYEGYLVASLFVKGLEKLEGGLTVGTLLRTFEALAEVDLGVGYEVGFSATEHQASHKVWITEVTKGGGFEVLP